MQITALSLRLAAAHKAGSPQAPAAAGAPRRPCPARGGFLMTRAASEGKARASKAGSEGWQWNLGGGGSGGSSGSGGDQGVVLGPSPERTK